MKTALLFFLSCTLSGSAASWYVRDGASGSGTTWTDAYDQLTSAETAAARGDTIYVADGTYTGVTFNTGNSGTTRITVQKATVASHGTETGWSDTYGDGQAVLGKCSALSGYWTINGVSRTAIRSGHGFKIDGNTSPSNSDCFAIGDTGPSAADSIVISYVEMFGSDDQTDTWNDAAMVTALNSGSNILTVDHCWLHDFGGIVLGLRTTDTVTLEHNVIERCDSSTINHAEGIVLAKCDNIIIRHNIIADMEGTAYIATPYGTHNNITNIYIYGNVFSRPSPALRGGCGNGILAVFDCDVTGAFKFYNNTIVGETDAAVSGFPSPQNFTASDIQVGVGNPATSCVELVVQNNLWVDCDAVANPDVDPDSNITTFTWSYNAYYNTTSTADPDGVNKQVLGSDPLPSWESGTFSLNLATTAGTTLSSPYDTDLTTATRGADGTWDRGAYEYAGGIIVSSKLSGTVVVSGGVTLR